MNTEKVTEALPAVVVDRSPELKRGARSLCLDDGPAFGSIQAAEVPDAVPGDGGRCVVAQACRQLWPGCEPHITGEKPYVVLADGRRVNLHLSASLVERIGAFDRGEGGFGPDVTITFRKPGAGS